MIFRRGTGEADEEEFAYLKEFFGLCASGLVDHLGSTILRTPELFQSTMAAALANDLRPGLAKRITELDKKQKVLSVRPQKTREVSGLISMAKSALLNEVQFNEWLGTRSKKQARTAVQFREVWHRTNREIDNLKSDIEQHGKLAEEYSRHPGLDLAEEGLVRFVSQQSTEGWHEFICGIVWECDLETEILEAAIWIVRQKECDRSTALAFLATAHLSDIGAEPYGYIDTSLAKKAMEEVASRLDAGGYDGQDLAVPNHIADDIEHYQSVAVGPHAKFDWVRQGNQGSSLRSAGFKMANNHPKLSFDRWVIERNSSTG